MREKILETIYSLRNQKQELLKDKEAYKKAVSISELEEQIAELCIAKKILDNRFEKSVSDKEMFSLLHTHRHIYKEVRALKLALAQKDTESIKILAQFFNDLNAEILENALEADDYLMILQISKGV